MLATTFIAALACVSGASAHVALWDKGMFGYNYPYQSTDPNNNNYNNDISVWPLRQSDNLGVDQWFAHGYKGYPPKSGDFMVLPAGGSYNGEINCNRAGSRMRDPARTDALPTYACDGEGALHTVNRFNSSVDPKWFGGTALAIAYTSDASSLQPSDMTIISVNHASVWYREISYAIPAGLPPCPPGGCLCTWNWIHQTGNGEGYGQEIYNNLYRCTVTGDTNANNVVQKGAVPRDCTGNPSACVKGPKTGMYLYQASGNNLPNLATPPNYNDNWGFSDGAQNDIFDASSATNTSYTSPTATALPTGWEPMGCIVDGDNRAMSGDYLSATDMTITKCTTYCSGKGFNYAGVENGNECWCTNKPNVVTAPDSDCSANCLGDTWAKCGGSWRLSAFRNANAPAPSAAVTPVPFPTASLPAGWSSLGCVVDKDSPRALNSGATSGSNNTVTSCIATCAAKGMPYAGTQYGQECWCGNTANPTSFTSAPITDCNVACAGDAGTLCGGSYRLSLYRNDDLLASQSSSVSVSSSTSAPVSSSSSIASSTVPVASSSAAVSPSASASSASSSIVISSSAIASSTSSVVSSVSPSPVAPSSTSTTSTFVWGQQSSVSAAASSTSVTPSSASAIPSTATSSTSAAVATGTNGVPVTWKHLGCQADSNTRVLKEFYVQSNNNTPAWCINTCASKGYSYAGVEYWNQCFCGNTAKLAPVSNGCNYACTGDKTQTCGGYFRMNLYQLQTSNTRRDGEVEVEELIQPPEDIMVNRAAHVRGGPAGGSRHRRRLDFYNIH